MIELPFPPASLSGHTKRRRPFTEGELTRLRAEYRAAVDAGELGALAASMGRSKCVLCEKAKELGLTDASKARKAAAVAAGAKARGSRKWAARPHPRGMAGKRHSEETKDRLRVTSSEFRASLSKNEAGAIAAKAMKTRAANGGSAPKRPSATWIAGWREIGGQRIYFRSRWEANYARYLEWLRNRGDILDWKYEPETFWFEKIKRGVRSYLPDFRVWENDGTSALHEVKGWMDDRSRTTLKRMAKYHPKEKIKLIREKDYSSIARQLSRLIPDWEHSERTGRW